jgi:hypothetical protein
MDKDLDEVVCNFIADACVVDVAKRAERLTVAA